MVECYPREAGAPPVGKATAPFSNQQLILTGPSGYAKRFPGVDLEASGQAVGTQREKELSIAFQIGSCHLGPSVGNPVRREGT